MKDAGGPGARILDLWRWSSQHVGEGRDRGWLLAFGSPEQLGRCCVAVTKTEVGMLVEAR